MSGRALTAWVSAAALSLVSCGARSPLGEDAPTPAPLPSLPGSATPHDPRSVHVSSLALGGSESCAVMSDGTVRCWGYAGFHQLGRVPPAQCGDGVVVAVTPCITVPTPVPGLGGVVRLAVGDTHVCALADDGTVRCWGTGQGAGVNDGDIVVDPTAFPIASPRVVALEADLDNTCARRADSTVWCWGDDEDGQLARRSMDGFGKVAQVAMGHNFTCARMPTGTVACAGLNDGGQLGNETRSGEEAHDVPSAVVGLSSVAQISSGEDHTCAALKDGTVACWGSNLQLVAWRLTRMEGLMDVVEVAAGASYTCARHTDGTVVCWGVNLEGQLGDGTHDFRARPTPVRGLHGVVQIAVRSNHACALTESDDVYCWGLNAHGEIGDGTTTDRSEPTKLAL